ncbi:MAG: hypothetical protein ACREJB_03290 [Planctomycetaceae bacterium]
MSLNKKQKKHLDVARKKLQRLQRLLADARRQPDEMDDVRRLEREIAEVQKEIDRIQDE